jgi:hypothetical protein
MIKLKGLFVIAKVMVADPHVIIAPCYVRMVLAKDLNPDC